MLQTAQTDAPFDVDEFLNQRAHQEWEQHLDSLQRFAKSGVADLPSMGAAEARILSDACEQFLDGEKAPRSEALKFFNSQSWSPLLWTNPSNATIRYDFLGMSDVVDNTLEKLLSSPMVDQYLMDALGSGYRLWWIQIRRANANAESLRMHQDRPGQTTLSILLDDSPTIAGTTVAIPGSWRWPRVLDGFPFISPRVFSRQIEGMTGKVGDMYLFSPTTWHGRATNDDQARKVLMISLVPQDSPLPHRRPPQNVIDRLGPMLKRIVDPDNHPGWLAPKTQPANKPLREILSATSSVNFFGRWAPIMASASLARQAVKCWRKTKELVRGFKAS
jgi:putative 2OG-Fe(II) oxygenase